MALVLGLKKGNALLQFYYLVFYYFIKHNVQDLGFAIHVSKKTVILNLNFDNKILFNICMVVIFAELIDRLK